jgi:Flp pilus assembly protein TadD
MIVPASFPTPCFPKARLLSSAMAIPVFLAIALAGCSTASKTASIDPSVTASIGAGGVDYWQSRYEKNPKDRTAALNFAAALRQADRTDQSVAVLQRAAIYNPNDREVLAAYGKALAANGQLTLALDIVRRAQTPDKPDWKLLSTEAAILDQLGSHDDARRLYRQALAIQPNDPGVLSNLGMSYVLTGDLKEAERTLRQAVAIPGADGRTRQNLALVVGLEGRFGEAEKIASADLPPDQAAANVAYLKGMLAQQDNWQKLKAADSRAKVAANIPEGGV